MSKNKKRSYIVIENVINVSILAVLAAGVIGICYDSLTIKEPTFMEKINLVLEQNETNNGKPSTMYQALNIIEKAGYDLNDENETKSVKYLWNQSDNRIVSIENDELENTVDENLWFIADNKLELDQYSDNYSIYLSDKFNETMKEYSPINGLDVGEYKGMEVLNYNNTSNEAKNITFRTNGGDVNIDAPLDTVNHYEKADTVTITSISDNTYNEYGQISDLEIDDGHVNFEKNSSVENIYINGNGCKVTIDTEVNNPETIQIFKDSSVTDLEVNKPSTVPEVLKRWSVSSFDELKSAIDAQDKTAYIILEKDIVMESSLEIKEGVELIFDTNGHNITVSETFTSRIFTNRGKLTIKGNGNIDVSNAKENGYGTVNNYGELTVIDGTYTNLKESNASNFYNRNGGVATFINTTIYGGGGCVASEKNTTTTIESGYFENETYPAIENRGNMLITGGTFKNTSCSSCSSNWGYTVRSGESSSEAYLKIQGAQEDSVKVTGVQGGLAVIGGTADIYNGYYETIPCEVHNNGASSFYAGYFTGESYKTSTTIYGGTFKSCTKTAILVGNGNPAPDSGEGKESTVIIHDGTFIGGDSNKTAITVNKVDYAIGAAKVYGGLFSSDPSTYVAEGYQVIKEEEMYKVEIEK